MAKRKTGLGRGLDAFLPSTPIPVSSEGDGVKQIPIRQISPNPRQPRTAFDSEELAELAASIQEHGVIQPVIVAKGNSPDSYTLIAGERRLEASKQAGLIAIPAIIREADEQALLEIALIENVQRSDLSPLEAAEAYRQLAEDFQLSQDEIAKRVGKSRVAVANTLRLFKLSPLARDALSRKKITEGHARALLGLSHPQAQSAALQTVLNKGFNVRQTEDLVRKLTGEKPLPKPKSPKIPEIAAVEKQLEDQLGTKVTLKPKGKGGTLVIHYYSGEELDSLLGHLLDD